jgi:hypothetical protein
VYTLNLVDGCPKMGARCWVENKKFWIAQCDILEKILLALERENITLAQRREAIRLFHETPLQLWQGDGNPDAETQAGMATPAASEPSFSAVHDEDEI